MAAQHGAGDGSRIVVIDDDPAVRNSLTFVLEVLGYRVAAYPAASLPAAEIHMAGAACLIVDHELRLAPGLDILLDLRRRGLDNPAVLTVVRLAVRQVREAAERNIALVFKPVLDDGLFDAVERSIRGRGA